MRIARILAGLVLTALLAGGGARAETASAPALSALAHLDPAASRLEDAAGGIALDLAISRAVPYRVGLRDAPPRLVIDFREVDFGPSRPAAINRSHHVRALAWGRFAPGWSRLVAELDGPYRIVSDGQQVAPDGSAVIGLRLAPATAADFAGAVASTAPGAAAQALPEAAEVDPAHRRQTGEAPLVVVLDPGHGGIDPGAEAAGESEAEVMLRFARELAEVLRRAGMRVVMTRDEDVFVPLETRISVARAAGADLFLSLHADALAEGEATGATVYLLAEAASDAASAQLAERHDRGDLLAGLDLAGQDDEVAGVLMDMARRETAPRADRLAGRSGREPCRGRSGDAPPSDPGGGVLGAEVAGHSVDSPGTGLSVVGCRPGTAGRCRLAGADAGCNTGRPSGLGGGRCRRGAADPAIGAWRAAARGRLPPPP